MGTIEPGRVCPVCLRELEADTRCPEHDQAPDPLVGTIIADSYRVVRVVGQGGMGRVYEGEDVRLGRPVAIKVLLASMQRDEAAAARLRGAARAVAALGHQHIVTVYDIGNLEDGALYLVMELLDGETLSSRVRRLGPMPLSLAARILAQTARALDTAHEAGLVHRDLKPENVMLVKRDGKDNFAKILDFGLAKPTGSAGGEGDDITVAGSTVGTPAYMSPEQVQGVAVDAPTDIYALGMVGYVMVCGRPAFKGTPGAVLVDQVTNAPPSPREFCPDLPEASAAALLRALAKEPADRFPSAGALALAFGGRMPDTALEVRAILDEKISPFEPTLMGDQLLTPVPSPTPGSGLDAPTGEEATIAAPPGLLADDDPRDGVSIPPPVGSADDLSQPSVSSPPVDPVAPAAQPQEPEPSVVMVPVGPSVGTKVALAVAALALAIVVYLLLARDGTPPASAPAAGPPSGVGAQGASATAAAEVAALPSVGTVAAAPDAAGTPAPDATAAKDAAPAARPDGGAHEAGVDEEATAAVRKRKAKKKRKKRKKRKRRRPGSGKTDVEVTRF